MNTCESPTGADAANWTPTNFLFVGKTIESNLGDFGSFLQMNSELALNDFGSKFHILENGDVSRLVHNFIEGARGA